MIIIKRLAEVKIQRGIFQGDALSLLLFVNAMITLNHELGKCTDEYKLTTSKKKINVHGRHQIVFHKRKRTENPNASSDNIQSERRDGIWHRKMHHANNERRETNYQIKKK